MRFYLLAAPARGRSLEADAGTLRRGIFDLQKQDPRGELVAVQQRFAAAPNDKAIRRARGEQPVLAVIDHEQLRAFDAT
jgi:hypothetical protein